MNEMHPGIVKMKGPSRSYIHVHLVAEYFEGFGGKGTELHGIPEKIVTDNGPQFTSGEFADFIEGNGIVPPPTPPSMLKWSSGAGSSGLQAGSELPHRKLTGNKTVNIVTGLLSTRAATGYTTEVQIGPATP